MIQPLALDFLDGRLNPTDAGIKIKIKIESKNIYSTGIKKINKKVIKKKIKKYSSPLRMVGVVEESVPPQELPPSRELFPLVNHFSSRATQ